MVSSKRLFKFCFYFYKKWLVFHKVKKFRVTSYIHTYFWWSRCFFIRVYNYPIDKWVRLIYYLSKNHKIIEFQLRLIINFGNLLIRLILLSLVLSFIWKPLLWFIHYFVYEIICLEYYHMLSPVVISGISILALAWVFPKIRKLIKISKAIRLTGVELEYDDGKYLSALTIQFYQGLNRNQDINKTLRKWPMGREVIALQMMNEEEITGRTSSQLFSKNDLDRRKSREKKNRRVSSLIKYFSERLDIDQTFNLVVNSATGKLDPGATAEDKKFFEKAQRDTTFKFRSKEFKVNQLNLVQFYQNFSGWKEASIASRSLYNYQLLYYPFAKTLGYQEKYFTGLSYNFFGDFQSSFIFVNNLINLQFLKISEFSKIFKSSKYFFQDSSEFPTRNSLYFFRSWEWNKGEYLTKLESPVSTVWNWENSLVSRDRNWTYLLPENLKETRGFENSQDLFWFRSVLDDESFHSLVHEYKHIFLFSRKAYNKISQRLQFAYDFYWSFHISTNIFLTYTFGTGFCFSSTYTIIPNWLFKNSLFTSLTYPVYQDNLATLFTHIWNLGVSSEIESSTAFSKILDILTTVDNVDNGLKILNDFHGILVFKNSYIDPKRVETFSSDFIQWRNNLATSMSARDRKAINDSIKNYLTDEINVIEPGIFSLTEAENPNHKRESASILYLYERTSATLSRYTLGEREKRMGIMADVKGILKAFTSQTIIPEDEELAKARKDIEFIKTIEQYDKKTYDQLRDVRITSRCFPMFRPSVLWQFYIIFVQVSLYHLLFLDWFIYYQNSRLYTTPESFYFLLEYAAKSIGL